MEIKGKVLEKGNVLYGKDWKSQLFVVEFMDGTYMKKLCLTCRTDNSIAQLENVYVGDTVHVLFNLESKKKNDFWNTYANAWKVKTID